MSADGIIWAVRYAGCDTDIVTALADAIYAALDRLDPMGEDSWTERELAQELVTSLDMKPSGAGEVASNVVRGSN